jgi:dUTP pyrophosphatase
MDSKLYVKRFNESALLPGRKSEDAAGYDLCTTENFTLGPGDRHLFPTGIGFTVPEGTYGQIAPRSGLSCKGILVGAGVIDRDYTGEVKVLLFNLGTDDLVFNVGDRIAQLIVKRIDTPDIEEVDTLTDTERGVGGFGSTGV